MPLPQKSRIFTFVYNTVNNISLRPWRILYEQTDLKSINQEGELSGEWWVVIFDLILFLYPLTNDVGLYLHFKYVCTVEIFVQFAR